MNIAPEYTIREGGTWRTILPEYRWVDSEVNIVRDQCREHHQETDPNIDVGRRVYIEAPAGDDTFPAAAVRFNDGAVYHAILGCFRHHRECIREAATNTTFDLTGAPPQEVQDTQKVAQRVREYLKDGDGETVTVKTIIGEDGDDKNADDEDADRSFPAGGPMSMLKHTRETEKHIRMVRAYLRPVIEELGRRSDVHDRSKLEEPEASGFAEYGAKLEDLTYGSDEYFEVLEKLPLDHHYQANRHHPEHFEDGIAGMHLVDLVEMFCDWLAATHRHDDGDIHDSIEQNRERFGFEEPMASILHNTADHLTELNSTPQQPTPNDE